MLSDDELIDGAETHLVRAVIGASMIRTEFGGIFSTGLSYYRYIFGQALRKVFLRIQAPLLGGGFGGIHDQHLPVLYWGLKAWWSRTRLECRKMWNSVFHSFWRTKIRARAYPVVAS